MNDDKRVEEQEPPWYAYGRHYPRISEEDIRQHGSWLKTTDGHEMAPININTLRRYALTVTELRTTLDQRTRERDEECDKYGLPHDFKALMTHIRANHEATVGGWRSTVNDLQVKLTEAQEHEHELAGCLKLVLQLADGGIEKPDPDYECGYCGNLVSDGHTDHCIVPAARAALATAAAPAAQWSQEWPKEPGWYWIFEPHRKFNILVYKRDGANAYDYGANTYTWVEPGAYWLRATVPAPPAPKDDTARNPDRLCPDCHGTGQAAGSEAG